MHTVANTASITYEISSVVVSTHIALSSYSILYTTSKRNPMDNSVIAQISEVEGRVVKTLILPDGQYQVRTYQGDGDTGARLFGTYVDPAEAEKEHQAAADVWLKP